MSGAAVGILKMPICNLQSIYNAVHQIGFDPLLVDESSDYDALSHLIVPGVGNFRAVMQHLEAHRLPDKVRAFAASGRPLLGICVGMQALAQTGTESGTTPGLGLLAGSIERLPTPDGLRLPHVGWSTVTIRHSHAVFEGVRTGCDFYFVHSYALRGGDEGDWLGETEYGAPFVSVVGRGNVLGFQFHPEKSQKNGLQLLENFCRWDGRC
jgi:glutamine amidotransferase